MSEENNKIELKEDELDKVVGGENYVYGTKCPRCRQEKLWDNGYGLHCKGCGWSSERS